VRRRALSLHFHPTSVTSTPIHFSTSTHPHPHPCALLRLHLLPHPPALSIFVSRFVEMRATRSQGRVCGVCTFLVRVVEESAGESVRSAS
jgi:hypothetical protein